MSRRNPHAARDRSRVCNKYGGNEIRFLSYEQRNLFVDNILVNILQVSYAEEVKKLTFYLTNFIRFRGRTRSIGITSLNVLNFQYSLD